MDYTREIEELMRLEYKIDVKEANVKQLYYEKCLINMASAAKFSSDRSILDYNKLIWHLK